MRVLIFLFFCLDIFSVSAQKVYLKDSSYILFSGCMEAYFSYDFNSGIAPEKPDYVVNYRKNREANINFGMIKASFNTENSRANFGLMTGNYVQYNLATESDFVRNIYEANIGFKLADKSNWWLDAGVLPSHIGFETMLTLDNKILTKSMAAENTPYYETGIRLSFTDKSEKWYGAFMLLNGWQRIGRNGPMGYGMQITYKHSDHIDFNYSNYWGKMNAEEFRFFNNLFFNWRPNQKIKLTGGFDIGYQKEIAPFGKPRIWFSPQIVAQYNVSKHIILGSRVEYFSDTAGIMIQPKNYEGVKIIATSLNIDYKINQYIFWRNEFKLMACDKNLFYNKEKPESRANDYSFTSAIVFQF